MSKNETLKLALEALLINCGGNTEGVGKEAITAINQALALDKMAENARELGLDYEPNYKVTVVDDQHPNGVPLEQWGRPAPVQPVAWLYPEGLEALKAGKCWTAYGTKQDDNCNISVYLAAVAPKVEPVKTECDGFDSHPAAPVQKPDAMGCKCAECGAWQRWTPSGMVCKNGHGGASGINQRLYTTPPAAQRQWVGLTDAERNKLWRDVIKWGDPSHDDVDLMKALEAKLKEKNT